MPFGHSSSEGPAGDPGPNTLLVGRKLFVDAVYGDDFDGTREDEVFPYSHLVTALAAASSGDTVVVRPGTYNECNLLKNGVNLHFEVGANVIYTGSEDRAIFDNSSSGTTGAITCRITGSGTFIHSGTNANPTRCYVVIVNNAGSDISIEFDTIKNTIDSGGEWGCIRHAGGQLKYSGSIVYCEKGFGVWYSDGNHEFEVDTIEIHPTYLPGVPTALVAPFFANPGDTTAAVGSISSAYTGGDVFGIVRKQMIVTGTSLGSASTIFWWPLADSGNGLLCRGWFHITEMVVGDGCVGLYHYGGKVYIHFDKMNGDSQTLANAEALNYVQGGDTWLWMNGQKMTGAGLMFAVDGGHVHIDLLHIEDSSNEMTGFGRFDPDSAQRSMYHVQYAKGGTQCSGVSVSGNITVSGTFDTSANASGSPIEVAGNGATVQDATLIAASGAADAITAGSAKSVTCNNVRDVSNKGKHVNVTIVHDPTL